MHIARWTLLMLLAGLAGCSDPKAATGKNFKAAAQDYLDSTYPKCYVARNFPVTEEYFPGEPGSSLPGLAKAGLVSETELSRREIADWSGGGKKTRVKSTFDLTGEGRKFYKESVQHAMQGMVGAFCAGKAKVSEIVRYTEPSDAFGTRVSRVHYTYYVDDLPKWASTPELVSAVHSLKEDVESKDKPIKKTETFVLTNEGWVHQELFKD